MQIHSSPGSCAGFCERSCTAGVLRECCPCACPGMSVHRPSPSAALHLSRHGSSFALLSETMFTVRSKSGQVASRLLTCQLLLCFSNPEARGDRAYQAVARAGRQQKSCSALVMLLEGNASLP